MYEDAAGIAGYAYAAPFHARAAYRWSAQISVYLAQDRRGAGIGRHLVGALLDELTSRGYVNAFAGTTLPNNASVRLFESLGFRQMALWEHVGFKLGEWHDVGWWQCDLRDPPIPPPDLLQR
jgi:phosphinothricin acetyltransferase